MLCGANVTSLKVTSPHSVTKLLVKKSLIAIIVEKLYAFLRDRVLTAEPVQISSNAIFVMQQSNQRG